MSNKFDQELQRRGPQPRRELPANFTASTLAKALAKPHKNHWFERFKKGYSMRFTLLKPAPLLLALGVMLTASSAAYAAFNWQQIQVLFTGSSHNKIFNAQEFGFQYKTCDALGGNNKIRFGVANNAKISAEQLADAIKARCEVAQAKQLFQAQADWKGQIPPDYTNPGSQQPVIDDIYFTGSIVTVERIQNGTLYAHLAVQDPHGKPLNQNEDYPLAKNLRVYANGRQTTLDAIKPGDRVIKVLHATEKHKEGQVYDTILVEIVGLIKVDAPAIDPALYNKAFEIMPCKGNTDTTCLDTPSPALVGRTFNANEGEGGNFHRRPDITRDVNGVKGGQEYQAQGRITAIDANGFTLQAFESTKQFRVNITNSDRQTPLAVGDAIAVRYLQKETENHTVINNGDIENSVIIMVDDETKF